MHEIARCGAPGADSHRHFARGELPSDEPVLAQFCAAEWDEEKRARDVFQQFAMLAEIQERLPAKLSEKGETEAGEVK